MSIELARIEAWLTKERDQGGIRVGSLCRKALRFAGGVLSAPFHLRAATSVGACVRTVGRPRLDNRGVLRIAQGVLLQSDPVPVGLTTEEGATLEIGAHTFLNYGVSVGAARQVSLGEHCLVGPYVRIADSEFLELHGCAASSHARPITIGDDVWIGAKATIMPGVTIGRGAVVGVSAVVTEDVEPFTVVAGAPARVLRRIDPLRFKPAGGRHLPAAAGVLAGAVLQSVLDWAPLLAL